jgi:hypothetical protein
MAMAMFYQPPPGPGRPKGDAGKMDQRDIELRHHYYNWKQRNARPGKRDAYKFARHYLENVERKKEYDDSDVQRIRRRLERALKRTNIRVF